MSKVSLTLKGFGAGGESNKTRGDWCRLSDPTFRAKATLSGNQSPAIGLVGIKDVYPL